MNDTHYQQPRLTPDRETIIRDIRDQWESYGEFTGDRRALCVVECLTHVLIESGCLP